MRRLSPQFLHLTTSLRNCRTKIAGIPVGGFGKIEMNAELFAFACLLLVGDIGVGILGFFQVTMKIMQIKIDMN